MKDSFWPGKLPWVEFEKILSLIGSYAYLRYLFAELPKAETVEAIEALLPGNLSEDQIRVG